MGPDPAVEMIRTVEDPGPATRERRESMQVSRPKILIGWKDIHDGLSGRELMRKELVSEVLLECIFGQSGTLFEDLYQRGLIDDSFGATYQIHPDVGHSMIGGDVPDPDALLEVVTQEIERVRNTGIDPTDVERQRRSAIGYLLKAFNSLEHIAGTYCGARFLDTNPFEVVDLLSEIGPDDINQRLQGYLLPDEMSCSLVVPG